MIRSSKEIFCDFETSGTNHLEDQPLTFSAKVYENGKQIDQINTHCRMDKSRLPSPRALTINQYPISNLIQSQSLRDMMVEINLFFTKHTPSTIFAHNASFDFNFSHSHYFQSLATDDWYQWKHNNKVICSLQLLRAIYLFKEKLNSIEIPNYGFVYPQFNLEEVSKMNGIFYQSHEAEGDVMALKDLYGLMINEAPEIVSQAHTCANKQEAKRIINDSMFFCTSVGTGPSLKARTLVPLAINDQGNAYICVDISAAKSLELNSLSSWDIYLQCKNLRKNNCIFTIPLNKGKVFFTPEYYYFCWNSGSSITRQELFDRAKKIRKNQYIKNAAKEAWKHIDNIYGNANRSLVSSIYSDGWCSPEERNFIHLFNQTDWECRWKLLESNQSLKSNSRIIRLAKKVIFEQDQSLVPKYLINDYLDFLNNKLFNLDTDSDVPWMNLSMVLKELEDLKSDSSIEEKIKELKDYYESRAGLLIGV